jgi:SAM-dependent methyltransferase
MESANNDIITIEDLFLMLDAKLKEPAKLWDNMYGGAPEWDRLPFLCEAPDENLVSYFEKGILNKPKLKVLEFGCGAGRNAIYAAQKGAEVTAIDISRNAISIAEERAEKHNVKVNFKCGNIFDYRFTEKYDFIYDSGCFHHLAPHRRISYTNILKNIMQDDGYYALTCFSSGTGCADEISDWDYYEKAPVGVAFTKEKIYKIFDFLNIIEFRHMINGVPDTIQGLDCMWTALMQKK